MQFPLQLLSISIIFISANGECMRGYTAWQGKCITINKRSPKTFNSANFQCNFRRGNLLQLQNEKDQLRTLGDLLRVNKLDEVWLGAQTGKVWYWSQGGSTTGTEIITLKFWGSQQPKEEVNGARRIALGWSDNLRWIDADAADKYTKSGGQNITFKALCSCYTYDNQHCDNGVSSIKPRVWMPFTTSEEAIDWDEAVKACQLRNADLIKIVSKNTQDAIVKSLAKGHNYWTAGYWNKEIGLMWKYGGLVSMDPSIWTSKTPNTTGIQHQCLSVKKDDNGTYGFSLTSCDAKKPYLCQVSHLDGRLDIPAVKMGMTTPTTTIIHTTGSLVSLTQSKPQISTKSGVVTNNETSSYYKGSETLATRAESSTQTSITQSNTVVRETTSEYGATIKTPSTTMTDVVTTPNADQETQISVSTCTTESSAASMIDDATTANIGWKTPKQGTTTESPGTVMGGGSTTANTERETEKHGGATKQSTNPINRLSTTANFERETPIYGINNKSSVTPIDNMTTTVNTGRETLKHGSTTKDSLVSKNSKSTMPYDGQDTIGFETNIAISDATKQDIINTTKEQRGDITTETIAQSVATSTIGNEETTPISNKNTITVSSSTAGRYTITTQGTTTVVNHTEKVTQNITQSQTTQKVKTNHHIASSQSSPITRHVTQPTQTSLRNVKTTLINGQTTMTIKKSSISTSGEITTENLTSDDKKFTSERGRTLDTINEAGKGEKQKSFIEEPEGIVTVVVSSLLVLVLIAVAGLLYRNKKRNSIVMSQHTDDETELQQKITPLPNYE